MKQLIYVNHNKEDNCDINKLNTEWKTILSNYISSRYITCNTYEVHNNYFIAIDDVDDDTIKMLNKVNITMNNGITYNCYVVDYLDTNRFRVSRKYEDEPCNVIDANYVGRVVIRATQ